MSSGYVFFVREKTQKWLCPEHILPAELLLGATFLHTFTAEETVTKNIPSELKSSQMLQRPTDGQIKAQVFFFLLRQQMPMHGVRCNHLIHLFQLWGAKHRHKPNMDEQKHLTTLTKRQSKYSRTNTDLTVLSKRMCKKINLGRE